MTTWYVDPEGGNDANDGQSFATRKRAFTMSLAAGDSVRVIASPDPISLGAATWTDNSGTVALAAAQTFTVDNCDSTWTGGTNVTTALSTGSSRKQGTSSNTFTIAAGFTGGLIGYKAVSNLDLSAYSCISMWMYTSGSNFSSLVNVALCSDSAGAVPIVTLTMPSWLQGIGGSTRPMPVLFENGGAALPSGVKSIALYASARPMGSLSIDNVIATKAWGAAGHLSHGCLIGKNNVAEPEWRPIMSIDGTTVVLGNQNDSGSSTPARPYRGTTESVTTYAVCPLRTRNTVSIPTAAGTLASPITMTGGWDRTAMASQTGVSWLSGEVCQNYGLYTILFGYLYLPDSTIGFAHYFQGATPFSQSSGRKFHVLGIVNCYTGISVSTASYANYGVGDYDLGNLVDNDQALELDWQAFSGYKLRIRRITGSRSSGITFPQTHDDMFADLLISQIDNCLTGIACTGRARVRGTTFKNNTNGSVLDATGGTLLLDRPILGDAVVNSFNSVGHTTVRCTAVNGNRWDNRVYTYGVTQTVDQTTVHGATAQSIKLLVNDYARSIQPYGAELMRVAVLAGKSITVRVWTQRSTTFAVGGLAVRGGSVAGVDDASVSGSAAAGTWEQLSLTISPTEDGVVTFYGTLATQQTASANGTLVYFGDSTVTST
jgi:hypothetical protein